MKCGKYTLVVAPKEYPGHKNRGRYVYEHHLVYWVNTGIVIGPNECIHHKNHNERDNRFENLELMTFESHGRLHAEPAKQRALESKRCICDNCKKEFIRTRRPAQRFCSRKCIGLFGFSTKLAQKQ